MILKKFLYLAFAGLTLTSCLPVLFTGGAASTIAVAKSRTVGQTVDDIKISAAIKTKLAHQHFHSLYKKVTIEVVDGRVLYLGKVEKEEDIVEAIKIAWDQKGVNEVISEMTVDENSNRFNLVQYTKDSYITSAVKTKLFAHRDIKFINYTIITNNHVVYVFGLARSEEELENVLDIISKIKGVDRVVEHVKIVNDPKDWQKAE